MTSLLDRSITAASDDGVYAAGSGTLPSCGKHARNYWNKISFTSSVTQQVKNLLKFGLLISLKNFKPWKLSAGNNRSSLSSYGSYWLELAFLTWVAFIAFIYVFTLLAFIALRALRWMDWNHGNPASLTSESILVLYFCRFTRPEVASWYLIDSVCV